MARRNRILLTSSARKDLAALPKDTLRRVDARILALADHPRPPGAEKVKGGEDLLRVRVGDYRILYEVEDADFLLVVARVRHRREVYRGL